MDNIEIVPFVYLKISKELYDTFGTNREIPYIYFIRKLKKILYFIPKKDYNIIIDEFIKYKLIEKTKSIKSPRYILNQKDYEKYLNHLKKIKNSRPNNRFKMLKKDYESLLKLIEKTNSDYKQKYKIFEYNYEKLLRKIKINKLEEYHYW